MSNENSVANSKKPDMHYFLQPVPKCTRELLLKRLPVKDLGFAQYSHTSPLYFNQIMTKFGDTLPNMAVTYKMSAIGQGPLFDEYQISLKEKLMAKITLDPGTGMIVAEFKPPIDEKLVKNLISDLQLLQPDKNSPASRLCVYKGQDSAKLILNLYVRSRYKGYQAEIVDADKLFKTETKLNANYQTYHALDQSQLQTLLHKTDTDEPRPSPTPRNNTQI